MRLRRLAIAGRGSWVGRRSAPPAQGRGQRPARAWRSRGAIGQIRAWDSTLYARFAVNSEAGLVPSASAWGDDEDGEPMVRIAYRVL